MKDKKESHVPFHRFIGIVHLPPCPNGCGNLVTEQKRKIVSKYPVDFDAPLDRERNPVKEASCQYLCQYCNEPFVIKVEFPDEIKGTEEKRLVA